MEGIQTQAAPAPAAAPTSSVVSSADFFATDAGSPAPILGSETTLPPAEDGSSASVLPPASTDAAPATEGASTEAPATEAPATEAGTDPWADLDIEDAPAPASQASAPTELMSQIATSLGLESTPQTPEQLQAAVAAEVDRRVGIATFDPVRQIDAQLGLSDRELVRADLNAHRTRYDTDASLDARVDDLEAEDMLTQIATELRTELTDARTGHISTRAAQLKAQSDALLAAQQQMDATISTFTDPRGNPFPDKIKSALSHYGATQQYLEDLLNQPTEWHVQQMARLHPKIGPVYRQQEEALQQARGATALIKELEHQTPELGGGAALPSKSKIVGADDFFS